MTPDTAALRARPVDHSRPGPAVLVITEAERDALCDAADEVERLRAWSLTLVSEVNAARAAHAALVADLRALTVDDVAKALCAEHDWDAFTEQWESNRDYWRALASVVVARITAVIDRHAGAGS